MMKNALQSNMRQLGRLPSGEHFDKNAVHRLSLSVELVETPSILRQALDKPSRSRIQRFPELRDGAIFSCISSMDT